MKKSIFAVAALPFILAAALFTGGCPMATLDAPLSSSSVPAVPKMARGEGLLVVSLAGVNVGAGPGRTMLPLAPQFTRYELDFGGSPDNISFYNSAIQLTLSDGPYTITVSGFAGDTLVAKSDPPLTVNITAGTITPATFTLNPYMDPAASNPVPGVLDFSLGWDGLSRMPYRAELLVERYADTNGDLIFDPPDSTVHPPIPQTLIPPEYRAGSTPGSIRLLDRDSAFVNLTGSLTLPPGEYLLTMSVTMDPADTTPASRLDIAHIYSSLTTPAPFYYGGGDVYISNTSPDSGAGFITGFTFTQTPNATTVIGSEPGLDGTRMIMIMVPSGTVLTALTPIVTTAEGAVITSPQMDQGETSYPAMDFTNPMIWTAQAKNGAVQKYTVVVSDAPGTSDDRMITNFFFKEHPDIPGNINQGDGTIAITLPYGNSKNLLTPIVTIIGKKVEDTTSTPIVPDGTVNFDFTNPRTYKVTSETDNTKEYIVTVTVVPGTSTAVITRFSIDGYSDRIAADPVTPFGSINNTTAGSDGSYPIALRLPYGVSLKNLTPVIQYEGQILAPLSGVPQNFSVPVYYTVTPQSGSPKPYKVTITNDKPDQNTGIFDFRVANVPTAKVVIGQKPRQDGKIPIVIQVPYGTDEQKMIAAITLSSTNAQIHPINDPSGPASGVAIPFNNAGYPKEAVYRVTAEDSTVYQDYVAVVSMGGQYYYVDGKNGNDLLPDYYNGETEGRAFKTLAYAVEKAASSSSITKIFILGDLSAAAGGDSTSQNAENGSAANPGADSNSAFTINGTNGKTITIASVTGSTISGTSGKRVLTVKGNADLVFENINITGGSTTENGGGIYITGNSTVKFSGGNITGNTARSGGGVYVEGEGAGSSAFNFMSGEISGNTATGTTAGYNSSNPNDPTALAGMDGGGGVYVKGNANFWLAPGGTISGNTTKGAGGGVLVNGALESGSYYDSSVGIEYGFIMSGGRIVNNKTTSTTYPHGGGGVYVAHGYFEMPGGEITGNNATRQGGGVFVHWGEARFNASGNSTVTGNEGVGSSKAICNRGVTVMTGNTRADKVYVWNYDDDPPPPYNPNNNQSFSVAENAQITGIVLAWSAENANVIDIENSFMGPNTICTIDLESHLNSGGNFAGQLEPDWLGKNIIKGANITLNAVLNRLPLNSFTGQPSVYNMGTNYRIDVSGGYGTFEKK